MITIQLNVSAKDIIKSIECDRKEAVFELIKQLDLEIGEYDFTFELAEYFTKELVKETEGTDLPFDVMDLLK